MNSDDSLIITAEDVAYTDQFLEDNNPYTVEYEDRALQRFLYFDAQRQNQPEKKKRQRKERKKKESKKSESNGPLVSSKHGNCSCIMCGDQPGPSSRICNGIPNDHINKSNGPLNNNSNNNSSININNLDITKTIEWREKYIHSHNDEKLSGTCTVRLKPLTQIELREWEVSLTRNSLYTYERELRISASLNQTCKRVRIRNRKSIKRDGMDYGNRRKDRKKNSSTTPKPEVAYSLPRKPIKRLIRTSDVLEFAGSKSFLSSLLTPDLRDPIELEPVKEEYDYDDFDLNIPFHEVSKDAQEIPVNEFWSALVNPDDSQECFKRLVDKLKPVIMDGEECKLISKVNVNSSTEIEMTEINDADVTSCETIVDSHSDNCDETQSPAHAASSPEVMPQTDPPELPPDPPPFYTIIYDNIPSPEELHVTRLPYTIIEEDISDTTTQDCLMQSSDHSVQVEKSPVADSDDATQEAMDVSVPGSSVHNNEEQVPKGSKKRLMIPVGLLEEIDKNLEAFSKFGTDFYDGNGVGGSELKIHDLVSCVYCDQKGLIDLNTHIMEVHPNKNRQVFKSHLGSFLKLS